MAKLAKVEGNGPAYAKKLQKAGVRSSNSLLEMGATADWVKQAKRLPRKISH